MCLALAQTLSEFFSHSLNYSVSCTLSLLIFGVPSLTGRLRGSFDAAERRQPSASGTRVLGHQLWQAQTSRCLYQHQQICGLDSREDQMNK